MLNKAMTGSDLAVERHLHNEDHISITDKTSSGC